MSKPSRLAFLAVAGALFAAALTLASFPATAQITPVIPRIVSKTGDGVPPLPGLAKIESVTWRGGCGKDGSLVVTIRNAGGPIRCHGVVSISRGRTLGGAVAGSAAFTGLGLGETKTFTIRVEGVFNCCPRDCYVVTWGARWSSCAGKWMRSGCTTSWSARAIRSHAFTPTARRESGRRHSAISARVSRSQPERKSKQTK